MSIAEASSPISITTSPETLYASFNKDITLSIEFLRVTPSNSCIALTSSLKSKKYTVTILLYIFYIIFTINII